MKKWIVALLLLSGCATPSYLGGYNGPVQSQEQVEHERLKERAERQKAKAEQEVKDKACLALMKPGVGYEKFISAWGKPDKIDLVNGVYVLHYEDVADQGPMIFNFKQNKLVGWTADKEKLQEMADKQEKSQQQYDAEVSRQQQAERDKKDNAYRRAVLMQNSFQNMQRQPTTCNSYVNGNLVTTNCN
jgi:hypothetical protein